jgi:hypothetical protein
MICTYMHVYECICTYMYVYVRSIPVQPLVEKDQQRGSSWLEQALCWPASQPVTVQPGHWVMGTAAAGPLETIMHSVPCCHAGGGPADSSSLESQPVMVRFQLAVHSGPGHAGDGRSCIRCSQCQADSSSHYDAGGRELSALRAGLILFSEPTISHPPVCHNAMRRTHDVAGLDYCILYSFS